MRIRGRIEQLRGRPDIALATFHEAVRIAEAQGSRSLALRAAIDLASAFSDGGQKREALAALRPVLAPFREPSCAKDVQAARGLVREFA